MKFKQRNVNLLLSNLHLGTQPSDLKRHWFPDGLRSSSSFSVSSFSSGCRIHKFDSRILSL